MDNPVDFKRMLKGVLDKALPSSWEFIELPDNAIEDIFELSTIYRVDLKTVKIQHILSGNYTYCSLL